MRRGQKGRDTDKTQMPCGGVELIQWVALLLQGIGKRRKIDVYWVATMC